MRSSNSVSTSHVTHFISITNVLMLFRKTVTVYSDVRMESTDRVWLKCMLFLLREVVHLGPAVP